jgi:hypothetical protein
VGSDKQPPPRPRLLTTTLILAWFMGLRTLHEGYLTLRILRDPLVGDSLTLPSEIRAALVEGVSNHTAAALPVAAAQFLLGAFLLVVSVGLLFGAARSVSFGLQAVFSNMLLAVVSYVASAPLRAAMVQALVASAEMAPDLAQQLGPGEMANVYYWGFRMALGLQLLALSLVAWVLSRRSVREFYALLAAARPEN